MSEQNEKQRAKQKATDRAVGTGLLGLGVVFALILFLAYDARMGLRFPGLIASLLLVLYGCVIWSRAGEPRESTEGGRTRLGVILMALGGWLAIVGLRAVEKTEDLITPVVYISYATGFVLFVFGGWLALVSQDAEPVQEKQGTQQDSLKAKQQDKKAA